MLKILIYGVVIFSFGDCIECPVNFVPIYDGCFLVANYLNTSQSGSEQFCSMNDGYLARIKSCTLLGDLVRYLHFYDLEAGGYWIGGTDLESEGEWRWNDGTQVSMGAPFWGWNSVIGSAWINEPNGEEMENCAILSGTDLYRFHDVNCESNFSPLCQIDPLPSADMKEDFCHIGYDEEYDNSKAGSCPGDLVLISGSCFHFDYNRATNWNDAYTLCRDTYDSHLAVLDSCDLFQAVVMVIRSNATYDLQADHLYWLGGTDEDQEGHWYWTNLAPMAMGPPFWGVTGDGRLEPSGGVTQNCANMFKDDQYYFHDTECEKGGHAICQRDPVE